MLPPSICVCSYSWRDETWLLHLAGHFGRTYSIEDGLPPPDSSLRRSKACPVPRYGAGVQGVGEPVAPRLVPSDRHSCRPASQELPASPFSSSQVAFAWAPVMPAHSPMAASVSLRIGKSLDEATDRPRDAQQIAAIWPILYHKAELDQAGRTECGFARRRSVGAARRRGCVRRAGLAFGRGGFVFGRGLGLVVRR